MTLDLRGIVVADLLRHYAGDDYSEEYAIELATELIRIGQIFESENVLIRYHKVDDGTIEFHCMNAGSGADLTNAINSLLKSLPKQFMTGVTYYDNPRINELAKFSYFPATIERIDGGKFKTYKMSFDLKER